VPVDKLVDALTTRSTLARGELIYSPISVDQAVNVRDALVKGIYGRVFISIVEKINTAIYDPSVSVK
jgi:myosin-7